MPNINVKNMPAELYELLKQRAAKNRRSINSEILITLENSLGWHNRDATEQLSRIEAAQRKLKLTPLTDAILRKAKQ